MCPTPPLPPEGKDECKGGGEEAQGDMEPIQAKKRKTWGVGKEEGGPQIQDDPKLQSDDSQQKKFNSEVNEATGLALFLVFMRREAKLPADMILPNQQEDFQNQGETVEHRLRSMDKIYDYFTGKGEIRIRRNSLRCSNQPTLDKEDIVWYLSSKNVPHQPLKVTKSWTDPWVIGGRVAHVLCRIKPSDTSILYPAIKCGAAEEIHDGQQQSGQASRFTYRSR
ncbi:MAG: hypothetical protein GY696_11365 [Gammaproteobacteria bacterium]|nr:hypothetical protein [Gammaproteobacteria bacterium]